MLKKNFEREPRKRRQKKETYIVGIMYQFI